MRLHCLRPMPAGFLHVISVSKQNPQEPREYFVSILNTAEKNRPALDCLRPQTNYHQKLLIGEKERGMRVVAAG